MGESAAKQVVAAGALSLGAHALAALLSILLPVVLPRAPADAHGHELTIIVEADLEARAPAIVEAPPQDPHPPETRPAASRSRPVPSVREIAIAAPQASVAAAVAPTAIEAAAVAPGAVETAAAAAVETEAARAARLRALLDPGAVARSAHRMDLGSGPSQRQGPQRDVRVEPGPGVMSEAEAEQLHGGHLRARAMAPVADRHVPLTARPRPDGTYLYTGRAFTAVIHPDGSVRYSDRDAIEGDFLEGGGEYTIDVNDLLMRAAGGDPYAVERLRFEEDNEALITRLAREHWEARMEESLRRLPGRVARIWSGSGSSERRRRRIFALWCDLDEGEAGDGARDAVERWVRENLPADAEDAFTEAELAALNASSGLTVRFAPYE